MSAPRASLDDLYSQNETIIGLLERLNENTYLLREAVYGQTQRESGTRYENPKHGEWGATTEMVNQLEHQLNDIADSLKGR